MEKTKIMKNIKAGNLIIIGLSVIFLLFMLFGGFNIVNEKIKHEYTKDLKVQLVEKDKQLNESVEHTEQLNDCIKSMEVSSKRLKDSIEYMHVSYMNDSYLKENFGGNATYWLVRHSYSTGEYRTTAQNVIKFDGAFSLPDLYHKIQKRDSIKKRKFIQLDLVQQTSEKEYYRWIKFCQEEWNENYVPY